jgi:hypothetical protein
MKMVLATPGSGAHIVGWAPDDIRDPSHPIHDAAIVAYRNMRAREAAEHDTRAQEALLRKAITEAVGAVSGLVIKHHKRNGVAIERSMAGDINRRISGRKKRDLGPVGDADGLNDLRAHYQWVRDLEQTILRGGLPPWLQ